MTEKYIYHVTTTTRHTRKSPRSEVPKETTALLKPWLEDMIKGKLREIIKTRYSCRIGKYNGKMIEFIISRLTTDFKQTDVIRFVVCNHSRQKNIAWALVNGKGDVPNVPFCAVQLLMDNFIPEDFAYLPAFADFERCIAWAWLDMIEDRKENIQ